MADFTHTSQADALVALGDKLGDPGHVHWPPAEVLAALRDALRWWNLATTHDCGTGLLTTTPGIALYQLSSTLLDSTATLLRQQTVTYAQLVTEIQYHLAESTTTDQFTEPQIASTVTRIRDEFIADTALVITPVTIPVAASTTGLVDLPDNVGLIRRAVWIGSDGRYTRLAGSDEQAVYAYDRTPSRGTPRSYSQAVSSPLQLRLSPPPATFGTLALLVAQTGPAVAAATGQLIGVPDDFACFIKYGAIAALLGDMLSRDERRRETYTTLHGFGLLMAAKPVVILRAMLDGVQLTPGALTHVDRIEGGWEGNNRGKPRKLSVAGPDCVMLTPVPDDRPHSVQLDVLRRMRVPVGSLDYLQVAREHLEPIYALTVWLLGLRDHTTVGDNSLFSTFVTGVADYGSKQAASAKLMKLMQAFSTTDVDAQPVRAPGADPNNPENRGEMAAEKNARRSTTVARGGGDGDGSA